MSGHDGRVLGTTKERSRPLYKQVSQTESITQKVPERAKRRFALHEGGRVADGVGVVEVGVDFFVVVVCCGGGGGFDFGGAGFGAGAGAGAAGPLGQNVMTTSTLFA